MYLYLAYSKNDFQYNIKTEISNNITTTINHCENLISLLHTSSTVNQLSHITVDGKSDVDVYNLILPYANQLRLLSYNNPHIDSSFIYFNENNSVLTTSGFDATSNISKYSWYYDGFTEDCQKLSVWSRKNGSFVTLYHALDYEDLSAGTVIINLDFSTIVSSHQKLIKNFTSGFALVDSNNNILAKSSNFNSDYIDSYKNNNKSKIFTKTSVDYLEISGYNWFCIFTYDNFIVFKQSAWLTISTLLCSLIILVLFSLFISYNRSKKLYEPIDSIVGFLQTSNDENYPDLSSDYPEIRYIIETLKSNIDEKRQFETVYKDYNTLKQYSLQLQIQPHFIYNTLEMIYLESYEQLGDNNTVSDMIYNLSRILSFTFKEFDSLVHLTDELDITKSYLTIQNLRFENQFDTIWLINDDIEKLLTPKLIFQPILENSIIHGILPAKRKCTIIFSADIIEDSIVFTIKDDGAGIDETTLQKLVENLDDMSTINTKKLGLKNVNMRIKLLFGQEYGCSISSEKNKGTEIKIRIPKIEEQI